MLVKLKGTSAALTIWTLAAAAANVVITTPRQFEVDIVFPHNETYKPANTMPIVLAIQNATRSVAGSLGGFTVSWQIRQLQGGQFNSTVSAIMDYGDIPVHFWNTTPSADTTLFVIGYGLPVPPATTYTPAVNDRYMLQWDFFRRGKTGGTGWQGNITDVQAGIPECPAFGGLVQIGPSLNATNPACANIEMLESRLGNPCAVKVDQAAASSISSRVSSSVSSSITKVTSSTSKAAGAGPARPVQTALAAACVLCGLAL
ncbi:hypothetical protein QBC46DRAFT_368068 [Diplogelasinospora grovesii]|uniref:DUF7136 domain-containing protein n=1 Tax=Diplogelasinospora grovesii TaxID=303347 RepID=A0AAN6RZM4_9PEZI|nr:hypothetical protein QBC46DRAFT_368068 [Diplogelasinospora grovesii]